MVYFLGSWGVPHITKVEPNNIGLGGTVIRISGTGTLHIQIHLKRAAGRGATVSACIYVCVTPTEIGIILLCILLYIQNIRKIEVKPCRSSA